MNRLLPFILFSVSFLNAMQPSYWQKYKDGEHFQIVDGEVKISARCLLGQLIANSALAITMIDLSKNPTLGDITPVKDDDITLVIQRNNINTYADRNKNYAIHMPLHAASVCFNAFYSLPLSSIYFEEAYENRNNLSTCAGNAFMGTGLAINSMLISAGGSRNLSSNAAIKNTLNGVSTAATAIETFKHAKQAYNLWDKDRAQAWEHVRYAGMFATFGVMPFVLDQYQKKVAR